MIPAVIWENKKERKEIYNNAESHVRFLAEELGKGPSGNMTVLIMQNII